MCGRYTLRLKAEELSEQLNLPFEGGDEWSLSYNVAPSQFVPVLVNEPYPQLRLMQWGLIPHWSKPAPGGKAVEGLINARSETVTEKPAFRDAFRQRRCLIPADGFYEWKKGTAIKQPFFFGMGDAGLMTFAGLWSRWQPPQGDELETFTILTCAPNDLLEVVHDRMPVIVKEEDRSTWLESRTAEQLKALLQPYPAEKMVSHAVSHLVNSPKINSLACIQPLKGSLGF